MDEQELEEAIAQEERWIRIYEAELAILEQQHGQQEEERSESSTLEGFLLGNNDKDGHALDWILELNKPASDPQETISNLLQSLQERQETSYDNRLTALLLNFCFTDVTRQFSSSRENMFRLQGFFLPIPDVKAEILLTISVQDDKHGQLRASKIQCSLSDDWTWLHDKVHAIIHTANVDVTYYLSCWIDRVSEYLEFHRHRDEVLQGNALTKDCSCGRKHFSVQHQQSKSLIRMPIYNLGGNGVQKPSNVLSIVWVWRWKERRSCLRLHESAPSLRQADLEHLLQACRNDCAKTLELLISRCSGCQCWRPTHPKLTTMKSSAGRYSTAVRQDHDADDEEETDDDDSDSSSESSCPFRCSPSGRRRSDYEVLRLERIQRNEKKLAQLGLIGNSDSGDHPVRFATTPFEKNQKHKNLSNRPQPHRPGITLPVRGTDAEKQGRATVHMFTKPKLSPRKTIDGTYVRPTGRSPLGTKWDASKGVWVRTRPSKNAAISAKHVSSFESFTPSQGTAEASNESFEKSDGSAPNIQACQKLSPGVSHSDEASDVCTGHPASGDKLRNAETRLASIRPEDTTEALNDCSGPQQSNSGISLQEENSSLQRSSGTTPEAVLTRTTEDSQACTPSKDDATRPTSAGSDEKLQEGSRRSTEMLPSISHAIRQKGGNMRSTESSKVAKYGGNKRSDLGLKTPRTATTKRIPKMDIKVGSSLAPNPGVPTGGNHEILDTSQLFLANQMPSAVSSAAAKEGARKLLPQRVARTETLRHYTPSSLGGGMEESRIRDATTKVKSGVQSTGRGSVNSRKLLPKRMARTETLRHYTPSSLGGGMEERRIQYATTKVGSCAPNTGRGRGEARSEDSFAEKREDTYMSDRREGSRKRHAPKPSPTNCFEVQPGVRLDHNISLSASSSDIVRTYADYGRLSNSCGSTSASHPRKRRKCLTGKSAVFNLEPAVLAADAKVPDSSNDQDVSLKNVRTSQSASDVGLLVDMVQNSKGDKDQEQLDVTTEMQRNPCPRRSTRHAPIQRYSPSDFVGVLKDQQLRSYLESEKSKSEVGATGCSSREK